MMEGRKEGGRERLEREIERMCLCLEAECVPCAGELITTSDIQLSPVFFQVHRSLRWGQKVGGSRALCV